MARGAFSDDNVAKELSNLGIIPVIVDGDVEKEAMGKYGVRGYPTIKFVSASGEAFGDLRDRSAAGVIAQAKGAVEKIKPRFTKKYTKILKAMMKMDKALAKKNYKNALKAISAVEMTGHKGSDYKRALGEKSKIQGMAKEQIAEAKKLMESSPTKAKSILKKVQKNFVGLPEADEAKKLIDEIAASESSNG